MHEGYAMSIQSTALGKDEKRGKRAHTHNADDLEALLYTRAQTAKRLNCCVMTVIRLEERGALDRVRLNPDVPNSKVYNRASQVIALAEGGDDA
jgi:hypothetical protein